MKSKLRKFPAPVEVNWIDPAFPPKRNSFPVYEVARILVASVEHILNLISEGEIVVPEENVKRAVSRPSILIPRENLVAFLLARTRLPRRKTRRRKAKK